MRTIEIENKDGDIIVSITEYDNGIKGICEDGYVVYIDGEKLEE